MRSKNTRNFYFPAVATYYQEPIALVKGEGEKVWDDQGNEYLDCFGGVLTVSLGHAEPRVNKAWIDQVNTIAHMSTLFANKPQGDLAEKLAEITPGNLKKSFFSSSGTEADDTAVLAAKLATGRQEVVVLRHSYSGRRRPLFVGRPFDVEADRVAGRGRRSRSRSVLLSMPVQRDARQLRDGVRE